MVVIHHVLFVIWLLLKVLWGRKVTAILGIFQKWSSRWPATWIVYSLVLLYDWLWVSGVHSYFCYWWRRIILLLSSWCISWVYRLCIGKGLILEMTIVRQSRPPSMIDLIIKFVLSMGVVSVVFSFKSIIGLLKQGILLY